MLNEAKTRTLLWEKQMAAGYTQQDMADMLAIPQPVYRLILLGVVLPCKKVRDTLCELFNLYPRGECIDYFVATQCVNGVMMEEIMEGWDWDEENMDFNLLNPAEL